MNPFFGLGQVVASTANGPVPVALLTDLKHDIDPKEVEFYGNMQFAQETVISQIGFGITAKNAMINGALLGAVLPGATVTNGSIMGVAGEAVVIPATPYKSTVTHGANYADDLGVLDLTANIWLAWVSTSPATGQYSVNKTTGEYTFAAADVGHNLSVNYSYTQASAGKTITITNQLAGTTPVFGLAVYNAYQVGSAVRYFGMKFPAAICSKLSWSMSPTKYTEQDLTFKIRASGATLATYYTQE